MLWVNNSVIGRPSSVVRRGPTDDGMTCDGQRLAFRQRAPLPSLGQQSLREIEPLGELAQLRLERLHAALQVVHAPLGGRGPAGPFRDIPPRHTPAVGVVKLA